MFNSEEVFQDGQDPEGVRDPLFVCSLPRVANLRQLDVVASHFARRAEVREEGQDGGHAKHARCGVGVGVQGDHRGGPGSGGFFGIRRRELQVPELHRDVARLRDRHLQHQAARVVCDAAHDVQTTGRARHEHGRAPVEHVLHHPLHRVFRCEARWQFAVRLGAFRVRAQPSHERGGVVPDIAARGLGEHARPPEIRGGRHGGREVDARGTEEGGRGEMHTVEDFFARTQLITKLFYKSARRRDLTRDGPLPSPSPACAVQCVPLAFIGALYMYGSTSSVLALCFES